MTFRNWYNGHKNYELPALKAKIKELAVITDAQFNNYLSERSTPTDAVQSKINEIAGETLEFPKTKSTAPVGKRGKKYARENQPNLFTNEKD